MRSFLTSCAVGLGSCVAAAAMGCGSGGTGASPGSDAGPQQDAVTQSSQSDSGSSKTNHDALADTASPQDTATGVDVVAPAEAATSDAAPDVTVVDSGADVSTGCASDAECPASAPVCSASHVCTAPQVTTPATLTTKALLITTAAYADAFQPLALLHTLTGVPTEVVTVESICAASGGGCSATDACNDTPKAIKDYIVAKQAKGVAHVVLGGDGTIVPARQTNDSFSNAILGVDYQETFLTDYYYSDFSQWDTNGDCVYGDPTTDSPAYLPNVDVTRVSVSSLSEVSTYISKALAYMTAYDVSNIQTALFLSNVATQLTIPGIGTTVPVDAALYFETPGRTLSQMPSDFTIAKLYSSLAWPGASQLTVAAETTAFQAGTNLVVHSGHGDVSDLTVEQDGENEFTGAMAYALQNGQYPIMVSCACDAATFIAGDGCAGQQFITAPAGGGVGYLGNSTLGLGIAGGMQLIDQLLKYTFANPGVLIGESVMAGHKNMPKSDYFSFDGIPLPVQIVDTASWRWTEKAATFLGDGLLPVYASNTLAAGPSFDVSNTRQGDFVTIHITPKTSVTGTLTVSVGGAYYQLAVTSGAAPVSWTVGGGPTSMTYGFASSTTLATFEQATLN